MRPRIYRSTARPNFGVLDLFAGCGGLTEGLTSVRNAHARLVPVGAVELDRDAAATYGANFGRHVFQGDIHDWLASDLPDADIVVGGPPCQGFSSLGRQDPHDPRNKLWTRYAEVVEQVRPAYFVLENVEPFLRSRQWLDLQDQTRPGRPLADYTFDGSPGLVRAVDYGAAQDRRRAVVVGRRRDMPAIDLLGQRAAARTTRDLIGDLVRRRVRGTELPARTSSIALENRTVDVAGVFMTGELHIGRRFTDVSLRRFSAIPAGGNRHNLPDELQAPCWRRHRTGSSDVMGRLHWDRPSVTIRTEFWKPEKGRYLHPSENRPITHLEAARLQGFPDDYRWCGSKMSIGRQIGNAVPVQLGHAVGAALLEALRVARAEPKAAE